MSRPPHRSPQTRLVLATLLERPTRWRHGYDLAKQTELQSGTLYPVLMRLADHGLLEETWETPESTGRPPRHVYRLTAHGIATARELLGKERPAAGRLRLSRAATR
jgi:DNA-binding PadR family transcriptional regulator